MNFSFDATAGTSQSTSKSKLEGNKIHSIILESCETQDIQGVKDPTQIYKVIKFRYSNDNGYYEHTIFEPREGDNMRGETEYKKNGVIEKIPQPSNIESMMLFFKHNIDAFVPQLAKEIDEGTKKLSAPTWDKLRELVVKMMSYGKGNNSMIKLIKDSKGEARFPGFFTSISKEGKVYVRNNFIGNKLDFTEYEKQKAANQASANISNTSNFNQPNSFTLNSVTKEDDINLDFDLSSL